MLSLLAKGERASAASLLEEREAALFEEASTEGLLAAGEVETSVGDSIAAVDAEAILPIILLHLDVYGAHRDDRRYALASHARGVATHLVELYAALAKGEDSRAVAADLLASLSGMLEEVQLWALSRKLLDQALALDTSSEAALLYVAAGAERWGEWQRTVDVAQRLLQHDPKVGEARLRLAVNLARLEKEEQARDVLSRITRERNADWTLSLAYQELARSYLAAGALEAAESTLRRGMARLPSEQRLNILLAYTLDRGRRPREALDLLELPAQPEPSARHTYSNSSRLVLARLRERVEQAARVRYGPLSRAFASVQPAEEP
jgi:tetratricopeptide (TPR) repeat protein